jgi:mono/diheme cytochrome c family protein
MVLRSIFLLATVSLLHACGGNENTSGSKEEKLTGQALYLQHCTICHGDDGKLGLSGATDLSTSNMSMEQIIQRIVEGKNAMPPMKEQLGSQKNVKKVADYLLTLRK